MTSPRITVITPNLNRGRFLERTICSVLDQGYDNLEYFVVDGGSTDDSIRTIGYYERELAGRIIEPDAGPADAINKALRRATGDYVGILHSDDLYLPGALDELVGHLRSDGEPEWVVGNCLRVDGTDHTTGGQIAAMPRSLASFLMHDSGVLPISATFLRRDLIKSTGGFDTTLRHAFDYDYWCRLLANHKAPWLLGCCTTARRERPAERDARRAIEQGIEYVETARRYASRLSLTESWALWRNRDQRRKIFALAEAEIDAPSKRPALWQQLLSHPWWLTDETVRQVLKTGSPRPAIPVAAPDDDARRAA